MANNFLQWGVRGFYELVARRLHSGMPGARNLRGWCASKMCSDVRLPVTINSGVSLPPSLRMGPHAGIGAGTTFIGPGTVSLGPHVTMGPQCIFITGDHPVPPAGGAFRDLAPTNADIVIEEDVFLGARVMVLPGVTIGRGAAVGAGGVVTKDVPAEAIVAGNPARPIRSRDTH